MQYIAPLVQTILWVGLIAAVLWRFDKLFWGLLVALQKRIEDGSPVKMGPVEIGRQLEPQDAVSQREKIESEVQEMIQSDVRITPGLSNQEMLEVRARYFLAEDLALRVVQLEYGASVNRQVTAGSDMGFDGTFIANGQLHIVEVKFFSTSLKIDLIHRSLERIIFALKRYGWKNVRIVLVLVNEDALEMETMMSRVQTLVKTIEFPVDVRGYSLRELQRQFGVEY